MCNVNCKLHVVKYQMSSQISRSLRSQKILWDMKQCIAMLNYNQSASIVYFLNWQQMLGVFWGVGKGKCCGVGRLRGVRGTAPISLGMCGILMWDGDTQNRRPNSCLACPHTFSHQHICTCWLLSTFSWKSNLHTETLISLSPDSWVGQLCSKARLDCQYLLWSFLMSPSRWPPSPPPTPIGDTWCPQLHASYPTEAPNSPTSSKTIFFALKTPRVPGAAVVINWIVRDTHKLSLTDFL